MLTTSRPRQTLASTRSPSDARRRSISRSATNATAVTVRVAHIDGAVGAVADRDYIEYGATVPANGLEPPHTDVTDSYAMVYSSSTSVSLSSPALRRTSRWAA